VTDPDVLSFDPDVLSFGAVENHLPVKEQVNMDTATIEVPTVEVPVGNPRPPKPSDEDLAAVKPYVMYHLRAWEQDDVDSDFSDDAYEVLDLVFDGVKRPTAPEKPAQLDVVKPWIVDTVIRWARSKNKCTDVEDALEAVFGECDTGDGRFRDTDGYTCDGFGLDGFNDAGFDDDGRDREGYDKRGLDRNGRDRDGFDYYTKKNAAGQTREEWLNSTNPIRPASAAKVLVANLGVEYRAAILAELQRDPKAVALANVTDAE
jgi:hypothetical protein